MAEFCLKCFNEINGTDDPPKKFIFSKEKELCEGCGEWTNVVIIERKYYYWHKFRFVILPFRIIFFIFRLILTIVLSPYLIYRYNKKFHKNK